MQWCIYDLMNFKWTLWALRWWSLWGRSVQFWNIQREVTVLFRTVVHAPEAGRGGLSTCVNSQAKLYCEVVHEGYSKFIPAFLLDNWCEKHSILVLDVTTLANWVRHSFPFIRGWMKPFILPPHKLSPRHVQFCPPNHAFLWYRIKFSSPFIYV